jgi:hypothetical protein
MTKKRLIIISSVVAAVLVVMGLVGNAVFAADPTDNTSTSANPQNVLMAKVAGILGIEQANLEAAFTQAQKEIRSEAEANRMAKLVADGKITQEQADQYKAWIDSRPDVPALVGPQGGQGGRGGMMNGGMMGGRMKGGPMMGRGFGERCTGENCPGLTDSATTTP